MLPPSERKLEIDYRECEDLLLPLLMEKVFHVTSASNYEKIIKSGQILPNTKNQRPYNQGSDNSCFNELGCVSLVDLRNICIDKINEGLDKYRFVNPPHTDNNPIFLVLLAEVCGSLIPWNECNKRSMNVKNQVVPYIEAGHIGPIELHDIDFVLKVSIERKTSTKLRL